MTDSSTIGMIGWMFIGACLIGFVIQQNGRKERNAALAMAGFGLIAVGISTFLK